MMRQRIGQVAISALAAGFAMGRLPEADDWTDYVFTAIVIGAFLRVWWIHSRPEMPGNRPGTSHHGFEQSRPAPRKPTHPYYDAGPVTPMSDEEAREDSRVRAICPVCPHRVYDHAMSGDCMVPGCPCEGP